MIDTSDGLSTDLGHICKASGVGAIVWAPKIPAVRIPTELRRLGLDALDLALHGGEDYELLFTVPKKRVARMPRMLKNVPLTIIGEITSQRGITLVNSEGLGKPLQAGGWDPFSK
jgi:thiamine-monophosphate kinase